MNDQTNEPGVSLNQPQSTNLYSSENPANEQVDLGKAGFEIDIPQKKSVPTTGEQENVVDSIVKQATVSNEQEDKILSELAQMDAELEKTIPIAPIAESGSKKAKIILMAVIAISIILIGYFFASRNGVALLGIEPIGTISESEQKLNDIKSEKITNHYIASALMLKELNYYSSQMNIEYQNIRQARGALIAEKKFNEYKQKAADLMTLMGSEFDAVNEIIQSDNSLENGLVLFIQNKSQEIPEESNTFDDALRIIRNDELKTLVKTDINNFETEKELLDHMRKIANASKNTPRGLIASVQSSRINWTEIIDEIVNVTQAIDPTYSFNGTENTEGISYSSFSFNAGDNRINVTGQTITSDDRTFTKIADLTDALELSDVFSNVDTRTFSKQADNELEDGFRSSIRLDFNLEGNE